MKKCPTCGQLVHSERDKLGSNVFVWTAMTVFIWGLVLDTAEWNRAWWADRSHVILVFAGIPAVALYFWVRYLRERRRK